MATIDISRDIQGLRQLQSTMRDLKSEYGSIIQAQKYDADSTELLTAKKANLQKQLDIIRQTTEAYSQSQARLKVQLDSGAISTSQYETQVAKLEQTKQKLGYTVIALNGQLNNLSSGANSSAISLSSLSEEMDKSTQANEKNTNSLREWGSQVKQTRADALIILGTATNLVSMFQSMDNAIRDWNATNEDGTVKMNRFAKALAILSIATTAASVAAMFFKNSWLGPLGIGIAIAGVTALIAGLSSAKRAATDTVGNIHNATGSLQAYSGMSANINRTTTQRSERTVNYNMNINANNNAKGYANNPQVINALSDALNEKWGSRIKR